MMIAIAKQNRIQLKHSLLIAARRRWVIVGEPIHVHGASVAGTPTNSAGSGSFDVQVADSLNAKALGFFAIPFENLALLLNQVKIVDGQISFQMTVNAGYTKVVQFHGPFGSGDWTTLTNVTVPVMTNVTVTDSVTEALRFYRFFHFSGPPK
jgi:hypothetical protein